MPVPHNPDFVGSVQRAYVANISDDTDLTNGTCRGLYLGTAGDVTVRFEDGTEVLFANLAAGVVHPISCRRILDTGTDALTDLLACH